MTGGPECVEHNSELGRLAEQFTKRVERENELFDKAFQQMDEIKDCVGKINTKVEKLDSSLNGKFERVGRDINGVKHECEERCTATEKEVTIWRRITFWVLFPFLLGGGLTIGITILRHWR